jgi:hypothetical protein
VAIDWDDLVIEPLADIFGEGDPQTDAANLVVYTPSGGSSFPLAGAVFDDAFRQIIAFGDGTSILNTTDPVLGVRLAAFPPGVRPMQGDSFTVPRLALTFRVKDVRPDGHGWALLPANVEDPAGGLNFEDPDNSALAGD